MKLASKRLNVPIILTHHEIKTVLKKIPKIRKSPVLIRFLFFVCITSSLLHSATGSLNSSSFSETSIEGTFNRHGLLNLL